MNCREFLHFLQAVPLRLRNEGELSVSREHAATCPACSGRLAEAESLEQTLGSLPAIAPTGRLVADVMERVHMEAPQRSAVRQAAPGLVGAGKLEKLGWAAAIGGNLALLGVYLYSLNTSAWLTRVLSPAVALRTERISWVLDSGSGLLIVGVGAILLAIGFLSLPGGPVSKASP